MFKIMRVYRIEKTQLERIPTEKGESIEEVLRRKMATKEKIEDVENPIYTPLADGVIPDYDIRADRFDVAIEAQDKFTASDIAKSAGEPIPEKSDEKKEEPSNETGKEE